MTRPPPKARPQTESGETSLALRVALGVAFAALCVWGVVSLFTSSGTADGSSGTPPTAGTGGVSPGGVRMGPDGGALPPGTPGGPPAKIRHREIRTTVLELNLKVAEQKGEPAAGHPKRKDKPEERADGSGGAAEIESAPEDLQFGTDEEAKPSESTFGPPPSRPVE